MSKQFVSHNSTLAVANIELVRNFADMFITLVSNICVMCCIVHNHMYMSSSYR